MYETAIKSPKWRPFHVLAGRARSCLSTPRPAALTVGVVSLTTK